MLFESLRDDKPLDEAPTGARKKRKKPAPAGNPWAARLLGDLKLELVIEVCLRIVDAEGRTS